MTIRSELIDILTKKNPAISGDDMSYILSKTFDYIASELAEQNRVEIRGFGTFEVKEKRVVSSIARDSGAMRKVVHYKQSSVFDTNC